MTSVLWLQMKIAVKADEAMDVVRFELVHPDGEPLPPFSAGAHIDIEVSPGLIRQYSLCNPPSERGRYVIGVLRDPKSRGGSRAAHDGLHAGQLVRISGPRNHFELDPSASRVVLLAGGIGVTPILAMAEQLAVSATPFTMHYCARSRNRAAFLSRIARSSYSGAVSLHFDDGPAEQKLDIDSILAPPLPDTHLYVCGPRAFIDFVLQLARSHNWPESSLHREYFVAPAQPRTTPDDEFAVQLGRGGRIFTIPRGRSVVQVLNDAGIGIEVSCEQGVCGTCLTRVLEGEPDHRDVYMTDAEHRRNDQMTLCCSRSKSAILILDL
jgi:vanillate O-demethylase ferredoxin subunit